MLEAKKARDLAREALKPPDVRKFLAVIEAAIRREAESGKLLLNLDKVSYGAVQMSAPTEKEMEEINKALRAAGYRVGEDTFATGDQPAILTSVRW